jgi:hypothetical protein
MVILEVWMQHQVAASSNESMVVHWEFGILSTGHRFGLQKFKDNLIGVLVI